MQENQDQISTDQIIGDSDIHLIVHFMLVGALVEHAHMIKDTMVFQNKRYLNQAMQMMKKYTKIFEKSLVGGKLYDTGVGHIIEAAGNLTEVIKKLYYGDKIQD